MKKLTRERWMREHLAQAGGAAPEPGKRRNRHYAVTDLGVRRNPASYCRPWTEARNREIARAVEDP